MELSQVPQNLAVRWCLACNVCNFFPGHVPAQQGDVGVSIPPWSALSGSFYWFSRCIFGRLALFPEVQWSASYARGVV